MDPYNTIKYSLGTEKAVRILEEDNRIVCIVHKKANKNKIKEAFEEAFKVKVTKINTLVTPQGVKKAYITLSDDHPAIDIATELGLM